jgi:hypothetical protein
VVRKVEAEISSSPNSSVPSDDKGFSLLFAASSIGGGEAESRGRFRLLLLVSARSVHADAMSSGWSLSSLISVNRMHLGSTCGKGDAKPNSNCLMGISWLSWVAMENHHRWAVAAALVLASDTTTGAGGMGGTCSSKLEQTVRGRVLLADDDSCPLFHSRKSFDGSMLWVMLDASTRVRCQVPLLTNIRRPSK